MRLLPPTQPTSLRQSVRRFYGLPQRIHGEGFTLIELVVVLGIIIMILGFATPGIIGIMRGKKVEQGVAAVIDILERTRVEAMTKNTYIWVGMANLPDTQTPSGVNELWLISFKSKNGEKRLSETAESLIPNSSLRRVEGVAMFPQDKLPDVIVKKCPASAKDPLTQTPSKISFKWTISNSMSTVEFNRLILFTPRGETLLETGETIMPPPEGYILISLGRSTRGDVSAVKTMGTSTGEKDMAAVMISGLTGRISTMRP